MGRIVRGPQELPAGRGLSLPYPPHRNPSPHSPNVVGPQRDLQFPEHLRGLLNSPLKLGAKHRGTLVGGARASANRACPPPTTGLSRSAAPTTSIQLPGRKSILRPHILPLHTHTGCTPHGHVQTQKRHTNASLHTHTHTCGQRIRTHSNMNTLDTHAQVHIHTQVQGVHRHKIQIHIQTHEVHTHTHTPLFKDSIHIHPYVDTKGHT